MTAIIGWDIGGAHVKAARAENGRIVAVAQRACAPHLGLAHLETPILETLAELGPAEGHRVTMTAELSDAFEDRMRGVVSVAAIAAREIGADNILFYAGARGFVARANIVHEADAVASANWRASAELVAQHCGEALFIDIGSTTTDIVPIRIGRVAAQGAADAERLACGELAYAGFSRGAPQAYARLAPIGGQWTPLVNEAFASMADVRRVLGDLREGENPADLSPTADGRPKTVAASRARLARLVGRDGADLTDAQAHALAAHFARAQLRVIEDQIALLASRDAIAPDAPYIGAGAGRLLVQRLAQTQKRAYRDFADLIDASDELRIAAANCAPAAALALLTI
ncbi:hydantoinase/oxoprolinase family protein [Methylocystis parvus]|uniref:H4MPT-linked C1 transfer pathway protein n=1 Tax=Methylocystis parvus TaxID=134 RepID=A0A6B8M038_9HYPH|nr:hydantoinase/oxoprolinase family protein [Methylocystis parvus]QGM98097.1 H4MPT-linked C1 transfer pathway protein [Methylocystis parvus]WBK01582.1 H4MPT-linked C1 transfer pathway protein [Methylocystis parvus OBBP]